MQHAKSCPKAKESSHAKKSSSHFHVKLLHVSHIATGAAAEFALPVNGESSTPEGKRAATPETELNASKGKRQKVNSLDSPKDAASPQQQAGNGPQADSWPADSEGMFLTHSA